MNLDELSLGAAALAVLLYALERMFRLLELRERRRSLPPPEKNKGQCDEKDD